MMNLNYCHLFNRPTKRQVAEDIIRQSHKEVEKHVYIENQVQIPSLDTRMFIVIEGVRIFEILPDELLDDDKACEEYLLSHAPVLNPVHKSVAAKVLKRFMREYYVRHRHQLHDKFLRQ